MLFLLVLAYALVCPGTHLPRVAADQNRTPSRTNMLAFCIPDLVAKDVLYEIGPVASNFVRNRHRRHRYR